MIATDVLIIGHLERDGDGNPIPKKIFSTSTLIRCPGHNIVVDTSGEIMKSGVEASLKQIGKMSPQDIDVVVLTHNHPDHVGNNSVFPNARFIIHSGEWVEGAEIIDRDEFELCRGVKLVHTPGHTAGSMSVFVEGEDRYAIVGDAVPLKDNLVKSVPPRLSVDKGLAMESMKRISEWADVIIPGHGAPFINPERPRETLL